MFSTKYPVNNYVPTKITEKEKDLDMRLKEMTYDDIIKNLDYHFENCYVTNFDLINNECRGDKLNYSRKFYETVKYSNVKENFDHGIEKKFIATAIKSERNDLHIEKRLIFEHFNKKKFEEKLESKGIFLSSMRKNFYYKKTDDCKSLNF